MGKMSIMAEGVKRKTTLFSRFGFTSPIPSQGLSLDDFDSIDALGVCKV